jgi:hypothetical protein
MTPEWAAVVVATIFGIGGAVWGIIRSSLRVSYAVETLTELVKKMDERQDEYAKETREELKGIRNEQIQQDALIRGMDSRLMKCEFALGLVKVSPEIVHREIHNEEKP